MSVSTGKAAFHFQLQYTNNFHTGLASPAIEMKSADWDQDI